MKYVYYQDVLKGTITSFHKLNSEWSDEEVENRVSEFNKTHMDKNAVVVEVEENSFIDFLIHKANERIQINKEILKELDEYLSEASNIVNTLRFGETEL